MTPQLKVRQTANIHNEQQILCMFTTADHKHLSLRSRRCGDLFCKHDPFGYVAVLAFLSSNSWTKQHACVAGSVTTAIIRRKHGVSQATMYREHVQGCGECMDPGDDMAGPA